MLASGGGSNLGALLEYLDARGEAAGGSVILVASDRSGAQALERARARGIPAMHLTRPADGATVMAMMHDADIDLIVLAGYLRRVPPEVTRGWHGRMINVHPALLPAFGGPGMYGVRAHRAVIDSGTRLSGATVHFVDEEYDRGPIIAQWPVPVFSTDTAESLAERVLRIEHLLYPRVVDAVAQGRIRLGTDHRVQYDSAREEDDATFVLMFNDAAVLSRSMDDALR